MRHLALVCVAAVALYLPTVRYGFVQDDRAIIASNPAAHSIPAALRAFDSSYWPAESGGGLYRPLAVLSYAVDWAVSGGRPGWMHLINAAWHGLATLLVTLVLSRWLSPLGALAAGLVFALHPVHVEGVASLVGRAELLVAVFMFAAVMAARRKRWTLTVACAALAMLSKEHGVISAVLILLDDWLESGRGLRYPKAVYAVLVTVTLAYLGVWLVVGRPEAGDPAAPFFTATGAARLAIALPAVARAAGLLLWPLDLSADYNPQVIPFRMGLSLAALAGAVVLCGVIWLGVWARRRAPAMTFAAGAAALAYLPTSNLLFPSGVVLAERALYLPVILAAALAGVGIERLAGRYNVRVAGAILAVVVAGLAARSLRRLPAWRDNRAFLLTLLEDHPESSRAHASAAAVLAGLGDTAGAAREYARADSLFKEDPHLAAGRGFFLLTLGDTSVAAPLVARARALLPAGRVGLRGEFLLAVARGDTARARAVSDTALGRYPAERRWYFVDSQAVIRLLRPAG